MKNPIPLFCMLLTILFSNKHYAQVSAYSFTQTLSNYGSANNGSLVGSHFQDDDVTNVNLPFNFTYNGSTYSNVNVCSNGYLSFNGLTGTEYYALSDMITSEVIAPFSQDLFMGTVVQGDLSSGSNTITNLSTTVGLSVGDSLGNFMGDFPLTPTITAIIGNTIVVNLNALNTSVAADIFVMNGSLRQNVTGTAPNRVCEFEYRNMTRFSISNEVINFKVRLYETTNTIEFLYGFMSPNINGIPSEVGLKGSSSSDFNSREVTSINTWSTSTAATSIGQVCDFSNSTYPVNGLSYVWTPSACVSPNLVLPFLIPNICAGESATLTVSGASTYSWSNGSTSASIVVSPSVSTTYTVTGFNGTCGTSAPLTQPVNALPSINVTSSALQICNGQSATLTANGASTYTWVNSGASQSIAVTPSTTTSYSVKGSDGFCENIASITITVNAVPSVSIAQTKTLICKGNSATLTASGATSYTWSNGTNNASAVVSPTANTVYTVTGANGSCVSKKTATLTVNNCTGLEDFAAETGLNVYPNPFGDELNITIDSGAELSYILSDALGKTVFSGTINASSKQTIQTNDLQAGLYILTLHSDNNTMSKKIIKR
ncbi:MAG: T9SS type A sorting domain-containing protein [Bacteroidia bacterium]|nr:T9SS type A sorting domain-containing protein [Bacteroidia bacterium]